MRPLAAALLLLACASCMVQGSSATGGNAPTQLGSDADLVAELAACDAVAPTDPVYPEARARAREVEARLRESHQLLHEGLLLRSEGRDQEALHCFHAARALWPAMPGLADWIRATEARQRIFVAAAADPVLAPHAWSTAPDGPVATSALPAAPGAESRRTARGARVPAEALLAEAESLLREGNLDGAIATLRGPDGAAAREPWRRQPLFSLLRQRGLLAYGRGNLDGAVADWVDALQLDPAADEVRRWLDAATREVAGLRIEAARPAGSR